MTDNLILLMNKVNYCSSAFVHLFFMYGDFILSESVLQGDLCTAMVTCDSAVEAVIAQWEHW